MRGARIVPLCEAPFEIAKQAARIFIEQWPRHYAEEYGIRTFDEMISDLASNYCRPPGCIDCTYAMLDASGAVVGTVALLAEDLRTHSHLTPWITCLYVDPALRGRGLSKDLWRRALCDSDCERAYLWTDDRDKARRYERQGAELLEEADDALVMKIENPYKRRARL